jgi:DNA-binding NtrC family response regulator
MSGDLVSLRLLVLSKSMSDRDLLRQGAGAAAVPVDMLECDGAVTARAMLAVNEVDVAFIDADVTTADRSAFIADAKAAKVQPFVFIAVARHGEAQGFAGSGADGAVVKPTSGDEAKQLIERCLRLRLPHKVLVVDDSLTMRSIVRKILVASRFRLDIADAQEGIEALKQIASGKFELVFLDYNMPGLNGVETLSEIKRQYPNISVVIMTSATDEVVADKARAAGAAAFLKKPFYPTDIDAILHRLFGLHAQR